MKQPHTRPLTQPFFLNLLQIQMPVGAITSILHRLTGVLLAVGVPIGMFQLWRSLHGEAGFAQVMSLLHHRAFQGVWVVLVWALAHHVLAGVRHMLSDINIGSTLHSARRSAWTVNLTAVAIALLALAVLP